MSEEVLDPEKQEPKKKPAKKTAKPAPKAGAAPAAEKPLKARGKVAQAGAEPAAEKVADKPVRAKPKAAATAVEHPAEKQPQAKAEPAAEPVAPVGKETTASKATSKPTAAPAPKDASKKPPTERPAGGKPAEGKAPKAVEEKEEKPSGPARIAVRYKEIIPQLVKEFGFTSVMQAPRLVKIVLNTSLGEAIANPKVLEGAEKDMTQISGQHPVTTRAKVSIAAFKLRKGMPIGMMVTLHGRRMYEFFDKLVNITLPRIRDFSGVSRTLDGRGNYHLGFKEQLVFPEIEYDKVDKVRGLEVSIVTTARNDQEGRRLLELLGMPFKGE